MENNENQVNEIENKLCCVCNGEGIKEGENALCPKHYQSEVIEKQAPKMSDFQLSVHLNWDEEHGFFMISYCELNKAVFQVKMTPAAFEKMTSDMVRTVKNYNLFQAQKYTESLKLKAEANNGEEKKDNLDN